jgi:hypothetical protein
VTSRVLVAGHAGGFAGVRGFEPGQVGFSAGGADGQEAAVTG